MVFLSAVVAIPFPYAITETSSAISAIHILCNMSTYMFYLEFGKKTACLENIAKSDCGIHINLPAIGAVRRCMAMFWMLACMTIERSSFMNGLYYRPHLAAPKRSRKDGDNLAD
jgi:hypothetical protein